MARVRLEGIVKAFASARGSRALDGVDLDIEDGTILAVLGPSGAGKTTLLRVIAGLERPAAGRVLFGDRDVTRTLPERRDVGFVFQKFALYPHYNVAENIEFGMRARGVSASVRDARVRALARALRIEALLQRRPASLSGGEGQRVALARALAIEPALLALDEPFSNLDARLRDDLRPELFAVQREFGATTLFVTHDQTDALSFADNVAVLHAGRVEQIGSPRDVYDRPANEFVARFVGSPPMAFVRGAITAERFSCFARSDTDERANADATTLAPLGAGLRDAAMIAIGVRAEDVRRGRGGEIALGGTVCSIDDRGASAYVRVATACGEFVCAMRGDAVLPRPGERFEFSFDRARTHAFDGESGRRLERSVRV